MTEKIIKIRKKIDALAQLTKELKPFQWHKVTLETVVNPETLEQKPLIIPENFQTAETGIIQVRKNMSFGPGGYHYDDIYIRYRHHAIIRADVGTFRYASNVRPLMNWIINLNKIQRN